MKIITSVKEMITFSHTCRAGGKTIGFVPTMGALHEGHLSLLSLAKASADYVVMSIFVNPTQFGPKEDFDRYPRPFERDCALAEASGCDIMFAPKKADMYPVGHRTTVMVHDITERLCGANRPGHFEGVATVVLKLFNIVNPHCAVFGAKDAQQVTVIRRMVTDLHLSLAMIVGPIIREADGLALSSRNVYLTPAERAAAPLLYRGLQRAEHLFAKGVRTSGDLVAAIVQEYAASPLIQPEYMEIVDRDALLPCPVITSSAVCAVACRMKESGTRLIDNNVLGGQL